MSSHSSQNKNSYSLTTKKEITNSNANESLTQGVGLPLQLIALQGLVLFINIPPHIEIATIFDSDNQPPSKPNSQCSKYNLLHVTVWQQLIRTGSSCKSKERKIYSSNVLYIYIFFLKKRWLGDEREFGMLLGWPLVGIFWHLVPDY